MARLRAYLVRSTYEWIVEHDMTPYFLVDVDHEQVEVPWEYVREGKIILNAAPTAVRNLQLQDDFVGFEASFSGKVWQIFFPTEAIHAIYARETGQGVYAREEGLGMLVNEGEDEDELDPVKASSQADDNVSDDKEEKQQSGKKPFLRVVK